MIFFLLTMFALVCWFPDAWGAGAGDPGGRVDQWGVKPPQWFAWLPGFPVLVCGALGAGELVQVGSIGRDMILGDLLSRLSEALLKDASDLRFVAWMRG